MSADRLVSTTWLAENLGNPDVRIIDIRGHVLPASEPHPHYFAHHAEYLASHIPSAVFVDWNADIIDPTTISGDIASPEKYAALMSNLGIDESVFVVAYDDANGMFAARMWWTLMYYGHHNVAILDGGWEKWVRESRATTAEIVQFPPRQFVPRIQEHLRATVDDVLKGKVLIDVRTVAEFKGEASRAKRSGHIPGAINIPRSDLVTPDGQLRPAAELIQIFAAQGITSETDSPIVYCNGGVSASYGLLALEEAGIRGGKVYDGSWKEWGNDDQLPIE